MTAGEERAPPRRRGRRAALAAAGLVALVVALAWVERVPIAEHFIDRSLADAKVPASYRVTDLGLGRQRLTNVVLGDPARPDLVADWVETRTDIGLGGPQVVAVRAGRVRLRARLADGRVSLGSLDRLLPAPSGKPFALPALDVDVADGRMRLETPAGLVGLAFAGAGKLSDGFRGRIAAVAPVLTAGTCRGSGVRATWRLAVAQARPTVSGPVRARRVTCGDVDVADAALDLNATLGAALDRWRGNARVQVGAVRHPRGGVERVAGTIGFDGTPAATRGQIELAGGEAVVAVGNASRVAVTGRYRVAGGAPTFVGELALADAALAPRYLAPLGRAGSAGAGTPIGPLAFAAARAATRAAERFDARAQVALDRGGVAIPQVRLDAASGARLALTGGSGLIIGATGARADTTLTTGGGGLPTLTATLRQPAPGAPVSGVATLAPYAVGGAVLTATPLRFTAGGGGVTRIAGAVALSGPLGDGRVERLRAPLDLRWAGTTVSVNPACAPLAFDALSLAGLRLGATRLMLCPSDGALVRVANGRVSGGARIAAPRLAGSLGGSPLTLAARGAEVRLAGSGFTVDDLAVRLGRAPGETRLDFARLAGRFTAAGIGGRFAGAAGRIGQVPLLMSEAVGDWRLVDGRLSVDGALMVADAQADAPRFQPLAARDVALTLADGRIAARGVLAEPQSGTKVADVAIAHVLASGTGRADLKVPGLAFTEGFQPDRLTRLTFGVIADVRGNVTGEGAIRWSPDGVTSTGTFATEGIDLAAAFGPVTGIAGTIRFTDLLALESAPNQVATIKSVNPGIAVEDGRIVYQTLPETRVKVESGRWPFAGGTLTLEPTLLDFAADQSRRMTFRVAGIDARAFLQQFDFKNLDATGTFDGELPMVFDQSGGRIENGRLTMRAGGGTLAYVGDLSQKDLGLWGNIAFQALRSLRYRSLDLTMNGPLAGEMVTRVRFAGVSQGEGAKSNFLVRRLAKLPFVFNIRIEAPFRGLLDSAASFYDPKRLVQRNLQPLLDEQNRRTQQPTQAPAPTPAIQPSASENMP